MAASLCFLLLLPSLTIAQSSSGGPCQTLDDCDGQLIRIAGKGDDDPDAGSHICSGGGGGDDGGGSGSDCQQSGTLTCRSNTYPTYTFSPPVMTSTAILTNNDFGQGGGGGPPSECDEEYHENSELVVALATRSCDHGSRCNQIIRITAENGRSTTAKVVDECSFCMHGCDAEHAGEPPFRNNVIHGSNAVWEALGLSVNDGQAPVTWTMA